MRLQVRYRNWRDRIGIRHITPISVWFGTTEHHPQPQWLLKVWDHDKEAERDYALQDCDFMRPFR